jgi:mevalonate kinase
MRGSAKGKVILLGEHAVVYGHPALAAAISREVSVSIEPAPETIVTLPGGMVTPHEVRDAAVVIGHACGFHGGFHAQVKSEIPLGGGLGSSAALGVALARAFNPSCTPDEAADLAMILETVLHGSPSGVDPAASSRQGVILFTRGEPPSVEPIQTQHPLWLVIAPTGIARGTRSTVVPLSERRKNQSAEIDPLLARIGSLVQNAVDALRAWKLPVLGAEMRENHAVLRELGVSCPELDQAVAALNHAGALGAKLTGAGGGGSAIGLAEDEAHARRISTQLPHSFVERVG